MNVEELLEIEQIRSLRTLYSACFDGKDSASLAELFCEDAVCELPERFGGRCVGRAAIIDNLAEQMNAAEPLDAIHVVTNPWITLTGPDTAHGCCYLIDLADRRGGGSTDLRSPGGADNPLLSLGRCEDDYRKVGGAWRFAAIRLPYFWAEAGSEKLSS